LTFASEKLPDFELRQHKVMCYRTEILLENIGDKL